MQTPPFQRIMRRCARNPCYVRGLGSCLVWTGALNSDGYGVIRLGTREPLALTHRVVYAECLGPIPHGHVLDHLCRNRSCVRPSHLEPVSIGENTHRGQWGGVWRAYREERQRQEDNLDAACIGYATERAILLRDGWPALVTFGEWLEARPFEVAG